MRIKTGFAVILALGYSALALPGDVPVDLRYMKIGDSACIFPVHYTVEGNVWVSSKGVYRSASGCILLLSKRRDGWHIDRKSIPLYIQHSHDAELKTLGFTKLGPAGKVLNPL